jgi:hypothetical protein
MGAMGGGGFAGAFGGGLAGLGSLGAGAAGDAAVSAGATGALASAGADAGVGGAGLAAPGATGIDAGAGGMDAVGMGTAATSANDFGLAGGITNAPSVQAGTFAPVAAGTAVPVSGPTGAAAGAGWGTYAKAAYNGINLANNVNKAVNPAPTSMPVAPPAPVAHRGTINAMPIPAALPSMSNPSQSMLQMPGANSLPTDSSYGMLLQSMLSNTSSNPAATMIGGQFGPTGIPGYGTSINPGYIIPGMY